MTSFTKYENYIEMEVVIHPTQFTAQYYPHR